MLPFQQPSVIRYSQYMADSLKHWTGLELISPYSPEALYYAPFVLVSHGIQADPVFRYANRPAQKLWNISWDDFVRMPSRLSAEPDAREAREQLLQRAAKHGFVDDYKGVRITSDGRRFEIRDCILWNVINETHDKIGQAARFSSWSFIS